MIADMDATSMLIIAENGTVFGYGMVWVHLILIVLPFFIQEVAGRTVWRPADKWGRWSARPIRDAPRRS
jgi:hypothetical protein